MKELSIEEKAKRYDEAIEIAKEINNEQQAQPFNVMTRVFLELAESEDEKIRQLLLRFVKYDMSDNYSDDFTPADCVAWLEKQGKNNMGISEATKQELEDSLNKALEKETPESFNEFLDEQGKQKEYTFKLLPRLLDMIEPTDRAKAYVAKLIDALEVEGYSTDAKIVREHLKMMNGEKVAMATMDEESVSEDLEKASKEWLTPQLDKSYAAYGETKQMELTHFDGYAMIDAIEFGAKWQNKQMVAKAIDVTVHIDAGGYPYIPQMELYDYDKDIPLAKEGDKVKVIVIKKE